MAWTAPMTAVANTAFTAAQFNTYIRDNLLETAPAKATSTGGFIVTTAANSVIQRTPVRDFVTTLESTSSTSYTDLASSGPSVTVTTGDRALVAVTGRLNRSTASSSASVRMSYAVSGASSVAASDSRCVAAEGIWANGTEYITASKVILETGLVPGSNTFTAKYRVSSGTGRFDDRWITVIPF